jgi:isoaspartyl peptidase/L-asparaginase-like protein (Ntn-hydrolase superfamily)
MQHSNWALILHGGAREIAPEQFEENRAGLRLALDAGQRMLDGGASAIDAVDAAVQALEEHPAFNAGRFCARNSDGEMELDAAIMDGTTMEIGAVAALKRIRYPVTVAKALLRMPTVLLSGEGAEKFAWRIGAEPMPPEECAPEKTDKRGGRGHDTVGCIALDRHGNIAVATSTGGLSDKMPGRIGDAPLAGSGFFADSRVGGVAFSGEGEAVIRTILAARAIAALEHCSPQETMDQAIARVAGLKAEVGGIALDARGIFGWSHNSSHFAVGTAAAGDTPKIYLQRGEARADA